MLEANIGDIIGSVYEWNNIKTKDFPLFRKDCFFIDDAVSPNSWVCEFVRETFLIFIRFKVDYIKRKYYHGNIRWFWVQRKLPRWRKSN